MLRNMITETFSLKIREFGSRSEYDLYKIMWVSFVLELKEYEDIVYRYILVVPVDVLIPIQLFFIACLERYYTSLNRACSTMHKTTSFPLSFNFLEDLTTEIFTKRSPEHLREESPNVNE